MNDHTLISDHLSDLLPLYVSGALDRDQQLAVEKHLALCGECQADLALWKAVSGEVVTASAVIQPPRGLADAALAQVAGAKRRSPGVGAKLRRMNQLLRSQMPLVHREIWPASAAVIALGYVAALIAEHSGFIYALAPLMAAACVSLIYGPENDPAHELTLATPTSPRQILLARLVLVFGYNLGLVLVATLGLLPILDASLIGPLVLAWLAPMTFLSAAALVLSLWVGASNAISITYIAWLIQLLAGPLQSPQAGMHVSEGMVRFMAAYQHFWQSPALLLALSAVLFAVAVWMAGRQEHAVLQTA